MDFNNINLNLNNWNTYTFNESIRITSKCTEKEFRIRQIHESYIKTSEIDKKRFEFNCIINLMSQDGISVSLNNSRLDSETDLLNKLKDITDENIKIKIEVLQNIFFPLANDYIKFYVYDLFDLGDFLKKVTSKLLIGKIKSLEDKINIILSNRTNYESSIFSFSEFSMINQDVNSKKIKSTSKNIMGLEKYESSFLTILPNAVPIELIDDLSFKKQIFKENLNLIFNYSNVNEVHLYNKGIVNISFNDFEEEHFESYSNMGLVIGFIYQDEKFSKEKLLISQNLIFEILSEDISLCFKSSFWENLLVNIERDYKLFVDDKVDSFIREKKEVIKDQFNLSNQISNQIADFKKVLMNNLMTIIGIFLSKFFIDALGKTDYLYTSIAIYIGTVFSIYLLFSFYISGDYRIEEKYKNRLEIMNTYYPKLFLTEDNLLTDLKNSVISPEIKDLIKIKRLCLIIYWALVIIFSILSCFRLGFIEYHNHI